MENAENEPLLSCSNGPVDGLSAWRRQRQDALGELAKKFGLPLGHRAEVWLRGGIRLEGILRLQEQLLWIEDDAAREIMLEIDGVAFKRFEIESCKRQD